MPRVDLRKYNKKVENPFAILWRLVCYFKHCRLLLTAAMLSILQPIFTSAKILTRWLSRVRTRAVKR